MQRKKTLRCTCFALFLATYIITSCGENAFKSLAVKDSGDAIFEDALNLIDQQDYDTAITKILSLPSSYLSNTDVKEALAGAYAGKCGLHFLNLVTELGKTSATTFFMQLMTVYQTKTPQIASCLLSEDVMKSFGTVGQRTSDQNFFLLIYGFAKIGLFLRHFADADQNGATDATFDSCDATDISDANVRELFTGLGLMVENITGITTTIAGGNADDGLNAITALCTSFGVDCAITNTSSVTNDMVSTMRDLMKSNTIGIESCALVGAAMAGCCP
jgi:hypothetical protein